MQSMINKSEKFESLPISLVAYTNLFKFVTLGRKNRLGGKDRKFINKEKEYKLLIDEINILKPKTIIFQSIKSFKYFLDNYRDELKVKTIYVGPHPSWHGTKIPKEYLKEIEKQ